MPMYEVELTFYQQSKGMVTVHSAEDEDEARGIAEGMSPEDVDWEPIDSYVTVVDVEESY